MNSVGALTKLTTSQKTTSATRQSPIRSVMLAPRSFAMMLLIAG